MATYLSTCNQTEFDLAYNASISYQCGQNVFSAVDKYPSITTLLLANIDLDGLCSDACMIDLLTAYKMYPSCCPYDIASSQPPCVGQLLVGYYIQACTIDYTIPPTINGDPCTQNDLSIIAKLQLQESDPSCLALVTNTSSFHRAVDFHTLDMPSENNQTACTYDENSDDYACISATAKFVQRFPNCTTSDGMNLKQNLTELVNTFCSSAHGYDFSLWFARLILLGSIFILTSG